MAELVEVLLALKGAAAFVAEADKASGSLARLGAAGKEAGAASTRTGRALKATSLIGAAGLYGLGKLAIDSSRKTTQLTTSTLALHRATGMSAASSSEWINLAGERGVSQSQLTVGMTKLSKEMVAARLKTSQGAQEIAGYRAQIAMIDPTSTGAATKIASLQSKITTAEQSSTKAAQTFAAMGIPLQDLQKGNTEQVLLKVADAMQHTSAGAARLTAAQTLFGRSGRTLLPLLSEGSKGVTKQLDAQKQAGNYLSGKGLKANMALVHQQRELTMQWSGMQVQLGTELLPVLLAFGKVALELVKALQPLIKSHKVLIALVGIFTTMMIASKVASMLSTAATVIQVTATYAWVIAQSLLNLTMYGFPLIWFVAAIVLVVAAVVLLVTHWKQAVHYLDIAWHAIVAGAEWVWNWLKKNWPYVVGIITGPIGFAAVLVIKHWKQIKDFVVRVIHDIEHAFERLVGWIKGLPGKIGGVASALLHKIPGYGIASSVVGGAAHFLGLAAGGQVSTSGPYLVGEHGAEIVTLPRGSVVSPINLAQLSAATVPASSAAQITIPLIVDGRELARAVATVTSDQLARR